MNGHGHDFGHEFVSEADTDTRFFGTSDTDSDTDMGRVMISDTDSGMDSDKVMTLGTDTTSDTDMSENLGHELEHGHTSDTRVRSSLVSV